MGKIIVQQLVTLDGLAADSEGDVVVWGSLSLTDQLFQSDGVDVMSWRICPIAIGAGRRALPSGYSTGALRMLSHKTYDSGLLTVDYALA